MFILKGFIILGWFFNTGFAVTTINNEQIKEAANDFQSSDYDAYNDDEENPFEQAKATVSSYKATLSPYFDVNEQKLFYVTKQPIKLFCPVKNFEESKQQILWYKEKHPITNGQQPLSDQYKLDEKYNLIIDETKKDTAGSYYCNVMPQNVRIHIHLQSRDVINKANSNLELSKNSLSKNESMPENGSDYNQFTISLMFMVFFWLFIGSA